MAPNRENMVGSIISKSNNNNSFVHKPHRLSTETIQRTKSDMLLFELSKEEELFNATAAKGEQQQQLLPAISEVEDAKCECCGMSEECTTEYVNRVRGKFSGKMICGLCAEAVNEEMEKNGGRREEALNEHMSACVRFNSFGRTHPVLFQAEAMREMLKSSKIRAKSISPRDRKVGGGVQWKGGGIARSSSCMSALTKEMNDLKIFN